MTPALAHTHLKRVHQDLQLDRHSDEAMLEASHCRRFTYKSARLSIANLRDQSVSAGRDDLVQLTTTPPLPGHLPLLIPRENNERCGNQEPDASPVSIDRSLHTVLYT